MNWLKGVAALALLTIAMTASAEGYSWKYNNVEYATQAQAEFAMRSSIEAGFDLYFCGSEPSGLTVKYNYCTPTKSVTHWFDEYFHVSYAYLCNNTNEIRENGYCASEEELMAAYSANYYAGNPDKCPSGSEIVGVHVNDPVETWGRNYYDDNGTVRYYASVNHITPVYADRRIGKLYYKTCNNPDSPTYTASFYVNRHSQHKCPTGYNAQFASTEYQWPSVCKGPSAYLYRVGQENASSSPATCAPCVPATGEKLWNERDFTFGAMSFDRHYASLHDNASGTGLGRRWSHSWNERLTPPVSGLSSAKAQWRTEQNDLEEFQWVSGSTTLMRSARATGRTLAKQPDGSWLLQGDGAVRSFTSGGQLTSIAPLGSPADAITFTWSSGKLSSATDGRGRSVHFDYDDGRLEAINDAVGNPLVSYGYNDGRLVSATYPGGKSRTYHYGEAAHLCANGGTCSTSDFSDWLTGVTDERNIRILTVKYDSTGRVYSVDKPEGAEATTLSYHTTLRQGTAQKAGEGTALWSFDGTTYRRPLTKAVSVGGTAIGTEQWEYPSDLLSIRYRNRRSIATLDQFDASGRKIGVVEAERKGSTTNLPEKRTTSTTWTTTSPALPATIEIKNAAGVAVLRVENTYNTRGQVATRIVTDPALALSRTTTWAYCEAADVADPLTTCPIVGLAKTITAPGGAVTTFHYRAADDAGCAVGPASCAWRKGDLWKTVNAEGHPVEILDHDAAGRPASLLDENGITTDFGYDARGRLTQVAVRGATSAGDAVSNLTWTDDGKVASTTDPDGVTVTFEYDGSSRLVATQDELGNRIELTLDAAGNVQQEQVKDAAAVVRRSLTRIFDGISRLATAADAFDNPTDFTYDADGNLLTVTDAAGTVSQNTYDNLDRLKTTVQDVGGIAATVAMQYDTLDRVTQVTDPKGLNTTYSYNAFGDLLQLASPDSGTSSFTYDAAGNRETVTDARGVVATYSHDYLGRVTLVDYSGGSAEDVTYTYDVALGVCATGETFAIGRLSSMTDASGSTVYCYDRRGNMVRKVQTAGGIALQVRYGYTLADRLAWVEYPDGTRVDYSRNVNGDITAIDVTRPGQAQTGLIASVNYHPFGPPAEIAWTGGRVQQRPLDAAGQPLSVKDNHVDAVSADFGFSAVGNLTSLTLPSGTTPADITIDYDKLGRLTAFKDVPTGVAIEVYSYDDTGNRTSFANAAGSQAYTYATNSHWLTDVAGTARTYDTAGNTLTIGNRGFTYNTAGRMATTSVGGVQQAAYTYTGAGEQVRRVAGATTTLFLYDETGQLLGQYDGTGAPLQQYLWLDSLPVGVLAGNQMLHVQPDHLGTPRAVIDPIRNVAIWTWPLLGEAFGSTRPTEDSDNDGIDFVFDLRFPGQRFDQYSELNQNYFRDYDMASGRYPTSDPAGMLFSWSRYGYANGSPFNTADPYGLFGVESFDPVFAAIYKVTGGRSIDDRVVNLAAGFGDGLSSVLSLGIYSTADARRDLGIDGGVTSCSGYYKGGTYAGYAYSAAFGWAGGLNGGARTVFWSGFSKGARWEAERIGMTLEKTIIGRGLDWYSNTLGRKMPDFVWDAASATLAANARTASAVIRATRPNATWLRIEKPVLDMRGVPIKYFP